MVVVTVVLAPKPAERATVDRLLGEFKDSLSSNRPDGMKGLTVLRSETGELLVEGYWRDAQAHRAYRADSRGAELFRKLADCCASAPVTYYGTPDASLSFHANGSPGLP
jgi:quinol monooxygenase YgiN